MASIITAPGRAGGQYRLCPGLQELLHVETIDASDLIAALEQCGAIVKTVADGPPGRDARRGSALWRLAKSVATQPALDPWEEHRLWEHPTELCVRHDFSPESGTWSAMETLVKMEDVPFAHGAMRECFRMKKMSQYSASYFFKADWRHCANYVCAVARHPAPTMVARSARRPRRTPPTQPPASPPPDVTRRRPRARLLASGR